MLPERTIIKRPLARRDLEESAWHIAQDSPRAGFRFLEAADKACEFLAEMPTLGGVWESPKIETHGLRVWPVPGFRKWLIFYRALENGIEVVRVLHGARDLAALLAAEG